MSAPAVVAPAAFPAAGSSPPPPSARRRPRAARPRPSVGDAAEHPPVGERIPPVTVTIRVGAGDPARRGRTAAVCLDSGPRTVTLHGRPVELSRREYDLLAYLVGHPRRVVSRPHLLERVWGDLRPGPRTVDVHISRLRRKLTTRHLVTATVRGVGYRLADDAPVAAVGVRTSPVPPPAR